MFHLGALSNCLIGLVVVQALPLASYTLYTTYFKLLVAFKRDSLTHMNTHFGVLSQKYDCSTNASDWKKNMV